jgi:beta-ribofuranosylaminobenzene 5'-phosphate synthase
MAGRRATVTGYPRLHLGLLDLGFATSRRYGGAGLALDNPTTQVVAKEAERFHLRLPDSLGSEVEGAITASLERLKLIPRARRLAVDVSILSAAPDHIGLGSRTTLLLSILRSVDACLSLDLSRSELQACAARGGTSGIGINAFFTGGFLVDGGHPQSEGPHLPSRAAIPSSVPPVVLRYDVSRAWYFHLLLPPGSHVSGTAERRFFAQHTPLPRHEVHRAIAAVYHGVAPAIRDRSLDGLKSALEELHSCGFKRRELANQSLSVRRLYAHLRQLGLPAGVSSLGPVVYAVSEVPDDHRVIEVGHRFGARILSSSRPRNSGHRVRYE